MPDQRPSLTTHPRVLLVEGRDDERVVQSICEVHRESPSFQILIKEGIDPLLKSISIELKVDDREAIGILADANDDINARWQSIRSRMPDRIDLPERPISGGIIVESQPRVGVWLMPDNASPGQLEDFVQRMIPTDDTIWPLAERYIDDIPTPDRKFPPSKISRAKLYAWLAARQDPRRMGEAIRTRDLATDGALCQQFVSWLRRLFG